MYRKFKPGSQNHRTENWTDKPKIPGLNWTEAEPTVRFFRFSVLASVRNRILASLALADIFRIVGLARWASPIFKLWFPRRICRLDMLQRPWRLLMIRNDTPQNRLEVAISSRSDGNELIRKVSGVQLSRRLPAWAKIIVVEFWSNICGRWLRFYRAKVFWVVFLFGRFLKNQSHTRKQYHFLRQPVQYVQSSVLNWVYRVETFIKKNL